MVPGMGVATLQRHLLPFQPRLLPFSRVIVVRIKSRNFASDQLTSMYLVLTGLIH